MLGYISIGYYDFRERELISRKAILVNLLRMVIGIAKEVALNPSGLLVTHNFCEVLPEDILLPQLKVLQGDRLRKEIEALIRSVGMNNDQSEQWIVVLRPGQGWISRNRLHSFLESLRNVDGSYAVSVKKFSILANPSWNVQVAERRYLANGVIRLPLHSDSTFSPLADAFPAFWDDMGCLDSPRRSQDANDLYIDDGSIYAFKPKARTDHSLFKSPAAIRFDESDPKMRPLYEQIGLFDIDKDQYLDVSILERIFPDLTLSIKKKHSTFKY